MQLFVPALSQGLNPLLDGQVSSASQTAPTSVEGQVPASPVTTDVLTNGRAHCSTVPGPVVWRLVGACCLLFASCAFVSSLVGWVFLVCVCAGVGACACVRVCGCAGVRVRGVLSFTLFPCSRRLLGSCRDLVIAAVLQSSIKITPAA